MKENPIKSFYTDRQCHKVRTNENLNETRINIEIWRKNIFLKKTFKNLAGRGLMRAKKTARSFGLENFSRIFISLFASAAIKEELSTNDEANQSLLFFLEIKTNVNSKSFEHFKIPQKRL